MHRQRDGRTYCVLPGGGIEEGEVAQDACLRELQEETGLTGTLGALLSTPWESEAPALYFSVCTEQAQPVLGGPEKSRGTEEDSYQPAWVPLDQVDSLDLVPAVARAAVQLASKTHQTGTGYGAARSPDGGDSAGAQTVVREATSIDDTALWPLASALATSYQPTWTHFREGLRSIVADPHATVIVAVEGENLIGYVHVLVHEAFHADGAIGWIEELMVHEDRRGTGCGRVLMAAAEQWARDTADVAYIAVATRRAERFYRAIGYQASATYFKKAFR